MITMALDTHLRLSINNNHSSNDQERMGTKPDPDADCLLLTQSGVSNKTTIQGHQKGQQSERKRGHDTQLQVAMCLH